MNNISFQGNFQISNNLREKFAYRQVLSEKMENILTEKFQQTTKNIDFNRIYIYKDIMDYFYALNASKTTKEAWERVLISKFDQELLNELQIIDSEQNKKQYIDTYNSLFFDHFLEGMSKEEEKEEIKNIPSAKDQEQMNKVFELPVKPEIKKIENKNENKEEKRGYDTKETSDLEELIGETLE